MNGEDDPASAPDAFRRGDPEQIAAVEDAVRHVVRSFEFRDPELESDLVQETLSRVLTNLSAGQYRGEASLRTYARRIARYTCLEHIRRRRRQVVVEFDETPASDPDSAPEDSFLWTEEHLHNLAAFAMLGAECRELLRLVSVENLSYRDAAARLGISEPALKSRVHRCRLTCREALQRAARRGARAEEKGRP